MGDSEAELDERDGDQAREEDDEELEQLGSSATGLFPLRNQVLEELNILFDQIRDGIELRGTQRFVN